MQDVSRAEISPERRKPLAVGHALHSRRLTLVRVVEPGTVLGLDARELCGPPTRQQQQHDHQTCQKTTLGKDAGVRIKSGSGQTCAASFSIPCGPRKFVSACQHHVSRSAFASVLFNMMLCGDRGMADRVLVLFGVELGELRREVRELQRVLDVLLSCVPSARTSTRAHPHEAHHSRQSSVSKVWRSTSTLRHTSACCQRSVETWRADLG